MALNRAGRVGPLDAMLVPIAGSSDFKAVAATETDFDTTMAAGETYVFTCDTDCYIRQGTAPVAASGADGSMFVPAGMPVLIDGGQGANLSVIRKSVDGIATLQKLMVLE